MEVKVTDSIPPLQHAPGNLINLERQRLENEIAVLQEAQVYQTLSERTAFSEGCISLAACLLLLPGVLLGIHSSSPTLHWMGGVMIMIGVLTMMFFGLRHRVPNAIRLRRLNRRYPFLRSEEDKGRSFQDRIKDRQKVLRHFMSFVALDVPSADSDEAVSGIRSILN